jgi:cytosine/adenosine deaminase-related metal-dependent hydrolase
MKMFCMIASVSDPEPGAPLAHEVIRHATLGNARSAGLQGQVGAIKPGHKADMVLLDLNDTAYLPYNSAARQFVYTETGRSIDNVMIGGQMVMKDRRVTTIDEDALRREVESLMKHFIADYDAVVKSRARALPYMLEAHRRMWQPDVGMNRFISRTRV